MGFFRGEMDFCEYLAKVKSWGSRTESPGGKKNGIACRILITAPFAVLFVDENESRDNKPNVSQDEAATNQDNGAGGGAILPIQRPPPVQVQTPPAAVCLRRQNTRSRISGKIGIQLERFHDST